MNSTNLITVTDNKFIIGTTVMIYSFLKIHPTFKGKIIILHDKLSEKNQAILKNFPNVIFQTISKELKQSINTLIKKYPDLKYKKARFYSLELFNMHIKGNILFCDSDIVFIDKIDNIFLEKDTILVCAEYINYLGYSRDKKNFKVIPHQNDKNNLNQTFNAGFIYIPKQFISSKYYKKALAYLDYKFWKQIKEPYTDQIVFNHILKKHIKLLPIEYNYLLNRRKKLEHITNKRKTSIKVLHFNGAKPWEFEDYLTKTISDIKLLPYFKLWQEYYIETFQYLAIKNLTQKDKT